MTKTVLSIITVLGLCIAVLAQDADYYKAIQRSSATRVQPAQFRQMEENALKDFSRPESYELLATSFGNTTEKVWAVIYVVDSTSPAHAGFQVWDWKNPFLVRQHTQAEKTISPQQVQNAITAARNAFNSTFGMFGLNIAPPQANPEPGVHRHTEVPCLKHRDGTCAN